MGRGVGTGRSGQPIRLGGGAAQRGISRATGIHPDLLPRVLEQAERGDRYRYGKMRYVRVPHNPIPPATQNRKTQPAAGLKL
jgi:hypothetical protein